MEYPVHGFFLNLLIILLSARMFAELAALARVPPVVGELMAGVVLGPTVLGWIEPSQTIRMLAEIGIILLLFEAGLETDIRQLARAGFKSSIVAVSGFALPFAFGFLVSYEVFERPLLESLFIGGTLTATSIGITIRVLTDLHQRHSHEAQLVLGAAVIDDILGVVLLAILYEFSIGGGISYMNAGRVLLFIAVFFLLAPIFAKLISLEIRRFDEFSQTPGLIPTTVVSLVLFFAWLSHEIGAPELLGGFAAGLALSRRFFLPFGLAVHAGTEFAERIDNQMRPIIYLFVPIFFVMVGLSLNLRTIDWTSPFIWVFSLSLIGTAIAGKLFSALFISERWVTRFAVGLAMIPRGEVGLIFAELGRTSNILSNEIYAALIIVIAFTTIFAPLLLKGYYHALGSRLAAEPVRRQ
ncbi:MULTISPECIES: cation:proton antiporter [Methylocaldum]|jgi:Kef-type K+ transport system membrane component KefB|uniref:cation:proton antiporter n=1 Tax=unclassified Methylocaldum TaxID=2622260 RepID=UPI000A328DC8|nr:cation:proton antiporter [Methylocaldum sp. RMAD-M]MBP1151123.1 Kef-type K+ transport system membrane component KefB [Methylocaldum sp. RMAD-M]MVF22540.1 cation:proton antiporter [Methylocaldum sp. BRCS4]